MELKLYPDDSLSSECDEVTEFNEELHTQLDEMTSIMRARNGLGLAANQVGILQRFFIMEKLVWVERLNENTQLKVWGWHPKGEILELINPVIIETSEELYRYREGCLSAPSVHEWVPNRSKSIIVRCKDRNGISKTYATSDIMSVCVQHEIDHLNGIFFFDRLPRILARAARKRWKKRRKKLGL